MNLSTSKPFNEQRSDPNSKKTQAGWLVVHDAPLTFSGAMRPANSDYSKPDDGAPGTNSDQDEMPYAWEEETYLSNRHDLHLAKEKGAPS
ncbi:MAG TPA: hypothetical protein VFB55_02915 [Verrucomicrobiae bacterium]|nr:hypothetical protein [Verrucomicrobiae bacterium]